MAGGGVFAEGGPCSLLCVVGWTDDARGSGAGPEGRTGEGAASGHVRPEFFELGDRQGGYRGGRVRPPRCGDQAYAACDDGRRLFRRYIPTVHVNMGPGGAQLLSTARTQRFRMSTCR